MTFYAVYETLSGSLISVGDVMPKRVNTNHTLLPLASNPNLRNWMWDEATRVFIPRPEKVFKDRWDNFLTLPRHSEFQDLYNALNPTRKTTIRQWMWKALGRNRYISSSEDEGGLDA